MSAVVEQYPHRSFSDSLAHQARVVRVLAAAEFKLKYRESALGYLWSVLKPLAMFSILYLVFGHFFKLRGGLHHYPIYLLVGIVLWTFFSDATTTTTVSFVLRGQLLRKMYFPRLIVPVSSTMTATMTLATNLLPIAGFVAWNGIAPRTDWLLILPLLLELYLFALAVAILLSTLYVRFRDMLPIWELVAQILFYATPIIYPLTVVPYHSVRVLELLNPFGQIVEDVRSLVLYNDPKGSILTASDVLGPAGRLYPIGILILLLAIALLVFRREEPGLTERV
ncbi:MAG TPA: ABC transporter permease [Gaiellaceae bacterium]|nr:ABC transporter permease [Gaiellaceae bacterium]